ncbi:MAG TPA: hypothetical protein PK961_03170 [bacterium]|nr:hypothetical protein [bacterium]
MKRLAVLFFLSALTVLATACWMDMGDDDDDDDNDDGGSGKVNCHPTACDNLTDPDECDDYEDGSAIQRACEYCFKGTLADRQVAQCILDYRHDYSGSELEEGCLAAVADECSLNHL